MKKSRTEKNSTRGKSIAIDFAHPTAAKVAIAGTFNNWRAEGLPMEQVSAGHWRKELSLTPGRYEYRLIVDGAWVPNPEADETMPNPFGGLNSVLRVNPAPT
jgi:1,4-alpha-glucan branching enzyme